MPELKLIQCSHSGTPDGKICLLGINKKTLKGEPGEGAECYKITKTISRSPRQFHLRKSKPEEEAKDPEVKPLRNLRLSQIELSSLELILILLVDVLFMGLISSFNIFDSKPYKFIQMLTLVVLTTLLGIAFNAFLVFLYKFLLSMEMREQSKLNSKKEMICSFVIRGFYVVCLILAVVLSFWIGGIRYEDPLFVIFQWVSVLFCSTALLVLVWSLSFYWDVWFPPKERMSEISDLTVNSASVNEPMD